MVVLEDIRQTLILKELGAKTEYTDIDLTIPANTTVTITYTVPEGYAWIKLDERYGLMPNRVFNTTVIHDESVEYVDVDLSDAFGVESARCLLAGVVYTKWTATVTNTDSVAHNLDGLIRAFLIRKKDIPKLLGELRKVTLSEEDMDALAEKIALKLRGIQTLESRTTK